MTMHESVIDQGRFELELTALCVETGQSTARCNLGLIDRTLGMFEKEREDLTFVRNYLEKLQDKIHKLKRKRDLDNPPTNSERLLDFLSQARNSVKEADATYNINIRFIHTHIVTNHFLAHPPRYIFF